jgi:hypothetical protein
MLISFQAQSENTLIENDEISLVNKILIVEGLFLLNSWMASQSPNTYGGFAALLFPLGAGEGNGSATTKWVGFIGAESIAIYNLKLDEDKVSKNDVFKNNIIGWHIFAGVTGLTGYIMGDFKSHESLRLLPSPNGGGQLVYSHKY